MNEIAAKINWFVDESGIENVLAQWINSGFIPTTNQINLNAAIEWCRFSCLVDCSKFNSANEFRFHCRYEIRMNLAEFAASTATDVNQTELEIYYHPIPVSVFFSFLGDLVWLTAIKLICRINEIKECFGAVNLISLMKYGKLSLIERLIQTLLAGCWFGLFDCGLFSIQLNFNSLPEMNFNLA